MVGLLKYAGNPAVVLSVVVAVLFGLYKWEGHKARALKDQAEHAIGEKAKLAEKLKDAATYNDGLKAILEMAAKEAERQALIAAAEAKKSRDRLRENNLLRKDIQNVTENPPVPLAIERVLDGMRSAVAGNGDGGADQGGNEGAANPDRPEVPAEANPAPETPVG